jgi:AraC-like DNA-binding protein
MRTLQRRLQAEGCSYRELRDGVLSRIAQERLADPGLPITALAEQLGFASASAFGKAFRRWTGSSARAYRQREST